MFKNVRILAWAAIAALAIAGAVVLGSGNYQFPQGKSASYAKFGGPFVMTDHNGKRFTEKELKGKPYAIFFGFTHCPEVCPTTLLEMTQTIAEMGKDADKMNFVFVSVDPERDTQELLQTYLSNFDNRIIGLRGTMEQTVAIAKSYSVYFKKQPTENDYTVNHTATTYLMSGDGRLVSTLAYQEEAKNRLKKMKRLVKTAR